MASNLALRIKKANAALMERGDVDAIGDFFATGYVVHITGKDMKGGPGMIRQIVEMYQTAFSGITARVDILTRQDDRVSWQRTIRAIHRGAFKGFPATNQPIIWREMATSRFENDLIVEEWFITDLAEQLLLARKKLKKA